MKLLQLVQFTILQNRFKLQVLNPTEGGARTRLYIQGNNFGSNTDDIKVKIGGLPAKVIGSNGNIIYCMVPFKASEGTIEVSIKGQDPLLRQRNSIMFPKRLSEP